MLFGQWYCVGRLDDLGLASPRAWSPSTSWGSRCSSPATSEGQLHGAYNVCRHRGVPAPPGRPPRRQPVACAAPALRCPYHSWTYGLDGRLMHAPHADLDGLDLDDFRLNPVAVETWGGFVFVHLSPERATPAGRRRREGRAGARQLRARRAGHRRDADLRGGRQLQGAARELQRVLPLRPGAPRALPAGAVLRGRGRRAGLGGRHPAPRGRVDLHDERYDDPRAAARPDRARAHPPQGRAGLPQPAALRLRRPRRRLRARARKRVDRTRGHLLAAVRRGRGRRTASTPQTPSSCGTSSTSRTGRSASRCSAACPRGAIGTAGSPRWRTTASTSAAGCCPCWRQR